MGERQHITARKKAQIWEVVANAMTPDDRDPRVVIATTYRGNEIAWLRDMARHHHIRL